MALSPDWRAFIESLNSHNVEYVVIGAVALAQHGFPRYTGDMDVLIRNSPENAARMMEALDGLGMGSLGLKAADFCEADSIIQFGVPPVRIDLLTSRSGVSFEPAWAGRRTATVEGLTMNIMGRTELIQNKKMTGRAQDLIDAQQLEGSNPAQS